ncbi:hypothetical protein [Candidatus Vidania fulgoroideorum]
MKRLIDKRSLVTLRSFYMDYIAGCFKPKEYFLYQAYVNIKFKLLNKKNFVKFFISSIVSVNINTTILGKLYTRSTIIISTSSIDFIARPVVSVLFNSKYLICTSTGNITLSFKLINHGTNKVINLIKYLSSSGISNYTIEFFTDSINDLPLLLRSDIRFIVNPSIYLLNKTTQMENRVVLLGKELL